MAAQRIQPSSGKQRSRCGALLIALVAVLAVALAGVALAYIHFAPLAGFGVSSTKTPTPPTYSLVGGGRCVTLGSHPTGPYANVQVSHDSFLAHSEPMLAENPANPLQLVGGSKFFTNPAKYAFQIGYFSSSDGGCTWTDGGLLPGYADRGRVSDITMAFGPSGHVYALVLYLAKDFIESGIAVSTSTDGGKTFGQPVAVYDNPTGAVFGDKPWIAVDMSHGPHRGAVYVAWSYDTGAPCGYGNFCIQHLGVARSVDGARTFSPVQFTEGNAPFCTNAVPGRALGDTRCDSVLGATPAVEPDGTLAIAYAYFDLTSGIQGRPLIPTRLVVVTSHDGGQTWSTPVRAVTVHDTPPVVPPDDYRAFPLPAFAADPSTSGRLYLAWMDEQQGQSNILVATSRDDGQTWSAPLRVNDGPSGSGATKADNASQPALAVAPDGVVSVIFFDARNDPTHHLLDLYLTQSRDHGASFTSNIRVTTVSSDPRAGGPRDEGGQLFFGDYQGLAADNAFVHPFWNDTRTGSQQIETAALPSIQP
ncbi:MAG: sialidase family protein [Ktedonobacterales bacterium]